MKLIKIVSVVVLIMAALGGMTILVDSAGTYAVNDLSALLFSAGIIYQSVYVLRLKDKKQKVKP